MQSATSSNPLIINGDFSKYNTIAYNAQYATTLPASLRGGYQKFTKGILVRYPCGYNGSYQSYRCITIYDDKIEIKHGYYNNGSGDYIDSVYGCVTSIALFTLPET